MGIGIASGVIGVVVMTLMSRWITRGTVASEAAPPLDWLLDSRERARCEASPTTWHIVNPPEVSVWAYDPATRRSYNADAPALRDGLWDALADSPVAIDIYGAGNGGVFAIRIARSGPCAVVAGPWSAFYPRWKLWLVVLGCALVAAITGAALSALGVVRPLVQRLARVRAAAASIGAADGYATVERDATDDLGQLARELDRAHDRIRADAVRLESQRHELQSHVADVAHDLRTPIASLQLALQQAASANSRDPALVQAIHDVVYIGGLIGNLKIASELREGWTPSRDAIVPLGDTVERAALRVRFLARQKAVALEVAVGDEPIAVRGDPTAVEQAVANVIENAVTHNLPDHHVAVIVASAGDEFILTVVDDGPGVDPGELPRLGERPFRTDAARGRDHRGHGLGLAITVEVCERLGWRLAFEREQPEGLRVTIRGPRVVGEQPT